MGIALTGMGMRLLSPPGKLDSKFFYDATYAEQFFRSLGPLAASAYFWCEVIDLLFMVFYSLLLWLLYRMKFSRSVSHTTLIPGVLDLIETLSILFILKGGQVNLEFLSVVSALKWSFGVILLLTLGVKALRDRIAA